MQVKFSNQIQFTTAVNT